MQKEANRLAQTMTNKQLRRQKATVSFAGEELWLDGRKALVWPDQQTLVVADMHLEKGADISRQQRPLPRYDVLDTLARLDALVKEYEPRRVLCLGDSFHSSRAADRLYPPALARLEEIMGRVNEWFWVLGNHDPQLPETIGGQCIHEWHCNALWWRHEPVLVEAGNRKENKEQRLNEKHGEVIGHYHPKATVRLGPAKFRGPCFWMSDTRLLLPAFGTYTGGLDINDPAITALAGSSTPKVFLTHKEAVYPAPANLF